MAALSQVDTALGAPKTFSLGVTDLLFSPRRALWVTIDFILALTQFVLWVRYSPYGVGYWKTHHLIYGVIFASCFCAFGLGLGFYERIRRFSALNVVGGGLVATTLATFISLAAIYFVFYEPIGRLTLAYGAFGAYLAIILLRVPLSWFLKQHPYRFTIIGTSRSANEIIEFCSDRKKETRFYRYIDWRSLGDGHNEVSIDCMVNAGIGDIVLAGDSMNDSQTVDFALKALQAGLRVIDEVDFFSQMFERLPLASMPRQWILREGVESRKVLTDIAKRGLDIVVSLLCLVIFSPLLLAIAAIIKLTSPGPVIFVQPRLGRYCTPFEMFKFRTMRANVSLASAEGGFTGVDDPRVTWIGKILRPLHFDELPQLWNILKGDMSIVGARPEALAFARRMCKELPLYELRYLLRPGLTGHAQILHGYAMDSIDDTRAKLSYDLYYLCNHSFWLDLRIILRTAFLLAKGAR